jgi:hypothetical protein
VKFTCKLCGKREDEPQDWLLAIELIKPGTDVRNTIVFANQWDKKSAYAANAVHFCSKQCKDLYLGRWHEELVAHTSSIPLR